MGFVLLGIIIIVLGVWGYIAYLDEIERIMRTPHNQLTYSESFQKSEREKQRARGDVEYDPMVVAILLIFGIPALPFLLYLV